MRILWWTNECVPYEEGMQLFDLASMPDHSRMVEASECLSSSIKGSIGNVFDDRMESFMNAPVQWRTINRTRKVLAIRRQLSHKRYDTDWRIEVILDRILEDLMT